MLDRRLYHVVAIARYGSFTAAGDKIGLTQSALTRSVKELESQIGYSIFERSQRGVKMTERGELFIERAAVLLEDTEVLLGGKQRGRDLYADILRVAVCPGSLEWVAVEPLARMIEKFPSARLNVAGMSFDRAIQLLRAGSVDVAIGFNEAFLDHADIVRAQLPAIRTTLFARRDHPILSCGEVTSQDVAQYPLIAPSSSQPYDAFLQALYQENAVELASRIHRIDYMPTIKRIVTQSDAIGFVTFSYSETPQFKKRFAVVPYREARAFTRICCATRREAPLKPVAREFVRICQKYLPEIADTAA